MKFEKEEDRLNFVTEILNHPEMLREVRVREWLAEPHNKDLYEEFGRRPSIDSERTAGCGG